MKLSMKLQDLNSQNNNTKIQNTNPVLLRAKVPVTVFGFPFLSSIAGTDASDVSLSLSTNFSSGPSLKLSYSPNYVVTDLTGTCAAAASSSPPLSVTLKSGIGLFGSPRDSSLMLSAHFTVNPGNPNPNPTFSLQIKPQFGNFSLHKITHSAPKAGNKCDKADGDNSFEFLPLASPFPWKAMESSPYKECLLSGMAVTAKTELPLMKRLSMSFRWGVNFTEDIKKQLPYLTVNKISIQRIDAVDQTKVKPDNGDNKSDLIAMKDLFLSTRKELEVLQSHNREMVWVLDEMKTASSPQGRQWAKTANPIRESYGDSEQQRKIGGGGGDEINGGKKEAKKNMNQQ
ncbi:uncharacterized protein LOC124945206 [Impatiens glandulifera]|uniref:uncharacterized protein LOC124945206 n=1 Tax=Impatiens glandulifera TaxID=253017 RepID=UPI001FB0E87C|nr:uncharacterized protein LOC124945206 [Impatiens glandulifera]